MNVSASSPQFNVFVKRKKSYLTSFLSWIVVILFLGVALLYLFMATTDKASSEMATAYYILLVPNIIKTIGAWSVIGLIILIPIYNAARRTIPAVFSFDEENVYISGETLKIALKRKMIEEIYFNDLATRHWRPTDKIQIVFKQKNRKMISFFLADYAEGDTLMEVMVNLNNGTMSFYEDSFSIDEEG